MTACAIFDLDGTLTDSREGIVRSLRHALAELERPLPDEAALDHCIGPPLHLVLGELLQSDDEDLIQAGVAIYRQRYAGVGYRENRVYDGIPEALAELQKAGVRMFVATSKLLDYARPIINEQGLGPYFVELYGASLDGTLSHKQDILAKLIAEQDPDLSRSVMVGDRKYDIEGARDVGLPCIAASWGFAESDELAAARPAALCHGPGELAAAVRAFLGV
ncbi:MAG: HAD hydrolase-like protein [Alphaproteobacteria bacterium]|jgi:phosphoglycolate phosphatase|nr:HAD hydrolase-like protein [Alphaproteobacteria bacterium]MDP7429833.1 HAD hydrolase-like protein [Alphaproteobacteria bacterium]